MKTLIIDGNNLIHRTFWTAKTQSERTGINSVEQINNFHIYFTLNAIHSYVSKYNPDMVIAVWDEKPEYEANIRKSLLTEYKGNRLNDATPHRNNDIIKQLLSYIGINSIFPRELEADDIISYIVKEHSGNKVIISVDKDFLQLVNNNITLFDPIRKQEYTAYNFEELTGYKADTEWLTAKCLSGDKSDNVPGIPKFGKVKIKKYLEGDIVLSAEQQDIFKLNHSIFTLDKYKEYPREQQYYKTQLEVQPTTNWKLFVAACEERNFQNILKKKESWYNLFFLKHKLTSLFK